MIKKKIITQTDCFLLIAHSAAIKCPNSCSVICSIAAQTKSIDELTMMFLKFFMSNKIFNSSKVSFLPPHLVVILQATEQLRRIKNR
jgi:hypothetical protein